VVQKEQAPFASPSLTLTLLVSRIAADHAHHTLALDDLALAAHFLD
jgi:hypothetical protein